MRSPSAALIVLALLAAVAGCGGSGEGATQRVGSSAGSTATRRTGESQKHESLSERYRAKRDADGDNDNLTGSRYDKDDSETLDFGHAADAADTRAIATLLRRYYAAAAAEDGASACRLIYSLVEETLAEDSGAGGVSGRTCAGVMAEMFKRNHAELAAKSSTLRITRTRVEGERARVVMVFEGDIEHQILLHRENGAWKLRDLMDSALS